MADKRISQLVERINIANNDVLPIVASGATTTNKVTISTIQDWMQDNLDVGVTSIGITLGTTGTNINVTGSPVTSSGNITINIPTASATNRGALSSADWSTFNSKVSSVGLSMPSAFSVANSPITGSGTIAVTGAGTVSQYVRGDGSLADFPQGGGGGGASVSYYLNGSVSQGTIGGIAYREINKTPILGAGTDFVAIADGYLASFITDAGDPALLEIPAGNWNFETYFSASSGGGNPTFYIELYKVDSGGTATLIASNSATPELIAFGTVINPYFSALAVPATSLLITDRLALRYYVARSGRTITLHTENSHLCQIITTFTTGLTALNGLTAQVQNFATGTSGTDFGISSASTTHTFNLPTASATNRGALSSADWSTFNAKQPAGNYVTLDTTQTITAQKTFSLAGASDTVIITKGSGAGFALDVIKAGNGEVIRVNKTSGTGNAMTVIGGNFEAPTIVKTGGTSTQYLMADGSTSTLTNPVTGTGVSGQVAYWNGTNSQTGSNNLFWDNANIKLGIGTNTPEGTGLTVAGGGVLISLDSGAARKVLELYATSTGAKVSSSYVGASSYGSLELLTSGLARLTIADTGGVTLTGALNGTSATFTGANYLFTLNGGGTLRIAGTIANTSGGMDFGLEGAAGNQLFTGVGSYEGGIGTNNAKAFHIATNGTSRLSIASTGAATFASSVGVGGSPTNRLTALASETGTQITTIPVAKFANTGNAFSKVVIGSDNANFDGVISMDNNATLANTKLRFYIGNGTGSTAGHSNDQLVIQGNGNVGIGTASPNDLMEIKSTSANQANYRLYNTFNDGANNYGIKWFRNYDSATNSLACSINYVREGGSGGYMDFHTGTVGAIAERMRITSGGNVGIGTTDLTSTRLRIKSTTTGSSNFVLYTEDSSANILFWVRDDGYINTGSRTSSPYNLTSGNAANMVVGADGTLYRSTSSLKYKTDIEDYDKGLAEVMQMRPVYYKSINEREKDLTFAGLIAEEIQELGLTEFVQYAEDGTPDALSYSNMASLLIKAIQELKTEIDSLKNQIK